MAKLYTNKVESEAVALVAAVGADYRQHAGAIRSAFRSGMPVDAAVAAVLAGTYKAPAAPVAPTTPTDTTTSASKAHKAPRAHTVAGTDKADTSNAASTSAAHAGSDGKAVAKAAKAGKVAWSTLLATVGIEAGWTQSALVTPTRDYARNPMRGTPNAAYWLSRGNVDVYVQTIANRGSGYEYPDQFALFVDGKLARSVEYAYEMVDVLRGGSGAKVVRFMRRPTLLALFAAHTGQAFDPDSADSHTAMHDWLAVNAGRYVSQVLAEVPTPTEDSTADDSTTPADESPAVAPAQQ